MFHFASILFLPLLFGTASVRELVTLDAISSFLGAEGSDASPFVITGEVSVAYAPGTSKIIGITDKGTSTIVTVSGLPQELIEMMVPGVRLGLSGIACRTNDQRYAQATHVRILGKGLPTSLPCTRAERFVRGECNYRVVRMRGNIIDCFDDEVDPLWSYFVLDSDGYRIYVYFYRGIFSPTDIQSLTDAPVELTGLCSCVRAGARQFLGPILIVNARTAVQALSPAPADIFDAPPLEDLRHMNALAVRQLGRRTLTGTALAIRHDGTILLRSDDQRIVTVEPSDATPPNVGEHIKVVGAPQTDIHHCYLLRARWRSLPQIPLQTERAESLSARDMLKDAFDRLRVRADLHGHLIRINGTVQAQPNDELRQLTLDDDGCRFTVDEGTATGVFDGLAVGSRIEVSGICQIETGNPGRINSIPRIEGFTVILRSPNDLVILKRPPWWTPSRFLAVISILLAALIAILIWNRFLNALVDRRSRQLAKSRTARDEANLRSEERMRIAVDLHDTLSQNLTGVALQIDAAEIASRSNPTEVRPILLTTRQMMQSCRDSLRNCLWDLRSRAFEERRFEDAIRKVLAQQASAAQITLDCDLPKQTLSENFVHQSLFMIRELVTNAIRHGNADKITISGNISDDRLTLSVADNGSGFDISRRPGPADGHFGLLGVEERVRRLGGSLSIESSPGKGTVARIFNLITDI